MILISAFLVERGYQLSKKKSSQPSGKYLGFELSQGQRLALGQKGSSRQSCSPHQETAAGISGSGRLLHIWVLSFGCTAKPLSEVLRGGDNEPLDWSCGEKTFWSPVSSSTNGTLWGTGQERETTLRRNINPSCSQWASEPPTDLKFLLRKKHQKERWMGLLWWWAWESKIQRAI